MSNSKVIESVQTCSMCDKTGIAKDMFYKISKTSSNYRKQCKKCLIERNKVYEKPITKEKKKLYNKTYFNKHTEDVKKYQKAYQKKHGAAYRLARKNKKKALANNTYVELNVTRTLDDWVIEGIKCKTSYLMEHLPKALMINKVRGEYKLINKSGHYIKNDNYTFDISLTMKEVKQ